MKVVGGLTTSTDGSRMRYKNMNVWIVLHCYDFSLDIIEVCSDSAIAVEVAERTADEMGCSVKWLSEICGQPLTDGEMVGRMVDNEHGETDQEMSIERKELKTNV